MQHCDIESKLIIAGQYTGTAHQRTIKAIQQALSKVLKWNKALISGQIDTMKALADGRRHTTLYCPSNQTGLAVARHHAGHILGPDPGNIISRHIEKKLPTGLE